MKTIVVYASKYGSTETYARWIAEALHADLYAVKAFFQKHCLAMTVFSTEVDFMQAV